MNRPRPRVAVTGASGWVGAAATAELERLGVDVARIGGRTPHPGTTQVDLASPSATPSLRRVFEGCDAVLHAAAHVHSSEHTQRDRDLFHAVNVDGTGRVLEAAEAAGTRRVVFVSTIGIHGFDDGRVRLEDDPPAPSSAYGATKWLAEELVRASSMETRIVRLATVVGAGDHANYARLARAIARGRFVVPGDGSAKKSVLAVQDAAELLARTVLADALSHGLFHLAHPRPLSVREIADTLASALDASRPRSVPLAALSAATRAVDGIGHAVGAHTDFGAAVRKLTTDAVVSTARAEANFPGHAYRSLRDVAASYRTDVVQTSTESYG